ncbi:uncharacterized protein EAE98_001607 [Botrytis deweyae]|uniref:Uncharacterized protein n=1 Tax=Botrytis deweyae TaxID=2478750 RepID=A0ABQ7IYA9_9HELO|nr:uncharacterized protein EAE98_001607 [Botrytis deweyae]KAF7937293.1 hypothetical protein EAE98_001607 [Botrytis deweyae]
MPLEISSAQVEMRDTYSHLEYHREPYGVVVLGYQEDSPVQDLSASAESDTLHRLALPYSNYFAFRDLSSYISRVKLGSISNGNSRTYDVFSVQEDQHASSTKPDGKRIFVFKSIVGPVVDVEMMRDSNPLFIDVLCDQNMVLSPRVRSLEWTQTKMWKLVISFSFQSVLSVAEEYYLTVVYPIDSLVATSLTDMDK